MKATTLVVGGAAKLGRATAKALAAAGEAVVGAEKPKRATKKAAELGADYQPIPKKPRKKKELTPAQKRDLACEKATAAWDAVIRVHSQKALRSPIQGLGERLRAEKAALKSPRDAHLAGLVRRSKQKQLKDKLRQVWLRNQTPYHATDTSRYVAHDGRQQRGLS